jgi:hypothetical protein
MDKACLVGSSLIGSLDSIRTYGQLSLLSGLDSTAEARNDPGFNEAPYSQYQRCLINITWSNRPG